MLDDDDILSKLDQQFVSKALEVVEFRFVKTVQEFENNELEKYPPDFAHQCFGDSETIFGYQNPRITVNYTAANLYCYVDLECDRTAKGDVPPVNIFSNIQDQMPSENLGILVNTKAEFLKKVEEQKTFKPFGNFVRNMSVEKPSVSDCDGPAVKRQKQIPASFELYRVTEPSPDFDAYLEHLQSVAFWYIDGVSYTSQDEHWIHYLLFEKYEEADDEGNMTERYAAAGYCSMYRFYHHPFEWRVRIAQMLLFPQYRKQGMGAKFLKAIYEDIWTMKDIYDITVEDPADNMIYLRDYLDCLLCRELPEFSDNNLKQGFGMEMAVAARNSFKIYPKQTRRVYEILRYIATDKNAPQDLKDYRIDIKRRLEKPLQRTTKDRMRFEQCVDPDLASQSAEMSPDDKKLHLISLYDATIRDFQVVINRITAHPIV